MSLRVVHIKKPDTAREQEVREFWENVLKPKWDKMNKERARKLFEKRGIDVSKYL
jgi:hypothetical protein